MSDQHSPEPSTGSWWAWVPVLLLGTMVPAVAAVAYVAAHDPHFALEPNYYEKALHWDQSQAEARESHALGYQLSLGEPLAVGADRKIKLQLVVKDRDGQPLGGAEVQVSAFPNAYASRIERVSLRQTAPGVYAAELTQGMAGLWELRVQVTRGTEHYRQVLRSDVGKGGAA